MQAFIKNGRLVINTQIQDNEREELYNLIGKLAKGVIVKELYNVEGEVSGIAFEPVEESSDEPTIDDSESIEESEEDLV